MNWDSQNYHYYVAHLWTENRFDKDFLAASIQSYLNPFSYLPFYWLIEGGVPSIWVSAILAAFHSLNIVLAGWLTAIILPKDARYRPLWITAGALMVALAPVFGYEVGTSFNDISTSVIVLAAYLALAKATDSSSTLHGPVLGQRSTIYWISGAFLLGVGAGLKLTNAIFALAVIPVVFAGAPRLLTVLTRVAVVAVAASIGFLFANGFWAARLWSEFGNPFFPFFNALFLSPDFPAFNISIQRFTPGSLQDALLFPFAALQPITGVYMERPAPDVRYLAFVLLLLVSAVLFLGKAGVRGGGAGAARSFRHDWLPAACAIALILWLLTSGNGRYFAPGAFLLGPVIMYLTLQTMGNGRIAFYVVCSILLIQAVQVVIATERRWAKVPWTKQWFETAVPEPLANEPYLYLIPSTQTSSFLVPRLHPESSFVNISGQVPLSLDRPGGARVRTLVTRHDGRIRSLYQVVAVDNAGNPVSGSETAYDGIFERFGLTTKSQECELITTGPNGERVLMLNSSGEVTDTLSASLVMSCALHAIPQALRVHDEVSQIEAAFDRIEAVCADFDPPNTLTETSKTGYVRRYVNTDASLWTHDGKNIYYWLYGATEVAHAGTVLDWQKSDVPKPPCRYRRNTVIPGP